MARQSSRVVNSPEVARKHRPCRSGEDGRQGFEREFLIRLAPVWLGCRWKLMGHRLHNWHCPSDLAFDLLGMSDYESEMRMLCRETHG
jgi:hypothetical protein